MTALQKEFVQDLLNNQTDKIERELNKLQGKDYITAILQLTKFVLLKMQWQQAEFINEVLMPQNPRAVTITKRK